MSKKGRPKSPETLENERIEGVLKAIPDYMKLTDAQKQDIEGRWAKAEAIRKEVVREYGVSASVPEAHAYQMASLGDESMEGREEQILARDREYRAETLKNTAAGGISRQQARNKEMQELCELNRVLIGKIKPSGNLSIHQVAKRIHREWDCLTQNPDAAEVEQGLKKRGIDGEARSVRTITDWINIYLQS